MFMAVENIRRQEEETENNRNCGVLLTEAEGFLMCSQGALCCCLEEITEGYCLQPDSSPYLVKKNFF